MNGQEVLEQVLEYTKRNRSSLAREAGLNPQRLYDIASGKTKAISYEIADKITAVYPEISRTFLISGEGSMLVNEVIDSEGAVSRGMLLECIGRLAKKNTLLLEQNAKLVEIISQLTLRK